MRYIADKIGKILRVRVYPVLLCDMQSQVDYLVNRRIQKLWSSARSSNSYHTATERRVAISETFVPPPGKDICVHLFDNRIRSVSPEQGFLDVFRVSCIKRE